MRAVGKLEHPHIIRAFDAGEEEGLYFLVMEHVAGADLSRLVRSLGPLAIADVCQMAREAALGLHYAHENGLVHRDVKPSNLMLSAAGEVKVLDLGLAQLQQPVGDSTELTREGEMLGTLFYMAPERLSGGHFSDPRCDIYSLGVAFYELLAGGLSLDQARQLSDVRSVRSDVPPEVGTLVEEMTAPRPEDRVESMAVVAEMLLPHTSGAVLSDVIRRFFNQTIPDSSASSEPQAVAPLQSRTQTAAFETTSRAIPSPSPIQSPPRTRWMTAAVACCLFVASLATITFLMLSLLRPDHLSTPREAQPPPPPRPMSVIFVHAPVEDDPALQKLLDEGDVIVEDKKTGYIQSLNQGRNKAPRGDYSFSSVSGELHIWEDETSSEAHGVKRLFVDRPGSAQIFSQVPKQPGAFVCYTGTLETGSRQVPYRTRLRLLREELVDTTPCWRMEVEVQLGDEYTETGMFLVNKELYENEHLFKIERGWLTAQSPSLRSQLRSVAPDSDIDCLTVAFDEHQDALTREAERLKMSLPTSRIGVPDVLVLFFGAALPSTAGALRPFLAANSERDQGRDLLYDPIGQRKIACWRLQSGKEQDNISDQRLPKLYYALYGNARIPFNFVKAVINSPFLSARMELESYGFKGSAHTLPSDQELLEWEQTIANLEWEETNVNRESIFFVNAPVEDDPALQKLLDEGDVIVEDKKTGYRQPLQLGRNKAPKGDYSFSSVSGELHIWEDETSSEACVIGPTDFLFLLRLHLAPLVNVLRGFALW